MSSLVLTSSLCSNKESKGLARASCHSVLLNVPTQDDTLDSLHFVHVQICTTVKEKKPGVSSDTSPFSFFSGSTLGSRIKRIMGVGSWHVVANNDC